MTSLLITGAGRSGTLYTATVIAAAGIDAGHERAVNIRGSRKLKAGEVEVSWLAAYLDVAGYTVQQVRHPLAAIASLAAGGAFDPSTKAWRWAKYAIARYPEIATQPTPTLRAACYWLLWNGGIQADERWQVETLTARQLNRALGHAGHYNVATAAALRDTPRTHESDAEPLTWDQLGPLAEDIRILAAMYGYDVAEPEAEPEPEPELAAV